MPRSRFADIVQAFVEGALAQAATNGTAQIAETQGRRFMLVTLALALSVAQPQPQCEPLAGMAAVLARRDVNFLLFGEYHGTVEMPGVAADAVCAAAMSGRPVVLGIEFAPENQPFLDAYLASKGDGSARSALLKAPAWQEEGGRTTKAILDLIEAARRLAAAARPVTVFAFDKVPTPPVSKRREEGLAEALVAARARVPGSIVIALTGSGHAGKTPWSSQTPPFPSTGQLLPADETLAFVFARPGGSFWGCHAANGGPAEGCKPYDMPAREPVSARGIKLDPKAREGFDGIYSAGTAYTASKPALAGD